MPVTVETVVSVAEAEAMWEVYDGIFRPLNVASPCRQSFYRDEFLSAMSDPEMQKVVLRDHAGGLISMCVFGSNLDSFPWLSRDYFRAEYPEEYANQRLFYFVALLTAPEHERSGHAAELFGPMTCFIADRDGLVLMDFCEANQDLPDAIARLTGLYALTGYKEAGVQRYCVGWATDDEERHKRLSG